MVEGGVQGGGAEGVQGGGGGGGEGVGGLWEGGDRGVFRAKGGGSCSGWMRRREVFNGVEVGRVFRVEASDMSSLSLYPKGLYQGPQPGAHMW